MIKKLVKTSSVENKNSQKWHKITEAYTSIVIKYKIRHKY